MSLRHSLPDMVRLVGPSDLRETFSHGFKLTFTNGVADEEVEPYLADHLLQIIDGLHVQEEQDETPTEEASE